MATNPRPILCDTDSEIQKTTECEQFFKQNDSFASIPDFSDSNNNMKQNTVKQKVTDKQLVDDMIYKFDTMDDNNDPDNVVEYITKNKFSTLIGEMRVDILSLVNLIGVLNKNVTLNNEEIQNLKKEVQKLVTENVSLKEKFVRLRDDQVNMRDVYDSKIDAISLVSKKQINMTNQDIRVVKKNDESQQNYEVNVNNKNETNTKETNAKETDDKNEFNDSLMEKRINKFKVVPGRTRTGTDMFGAQVETKEELPLSNTTRQIMRKENVDNALKKTKDTSQIRGARLGLLSESEKSQTSSTAPTKNVKTNQKQTSNRVSARRQ